MQLNEYFSLIPKIVTDRYILRSIELEDARSYAKCIANPDTYRYWGRAMSEEEKNVIGAIEESREEIKKGEKLLWGIAKKDTNEIIGDIDLFNFTGPREAEPVIVEIGYRLAPEYWRKGVISEAIKYVVNFVFENTNIIRIHARVMCENYGSKRVLEKNGFKEEGIIRSGVMVDEICDYYILAILKDDG